MEGLSAQRCREIVRKMLADHGWQLVEEEERFTAEICAEICQRNFTDTRQERLAIQRAVMRHYCVILYAACAGTVLSRQRRAFTELWNYLFPIALYKTHDSQVAQDLTQQALEKIWKRLAQCRDAASFLAWSSMVLLNEIRDWARKRKRLPLASTEVLTETELRHSEDPAQLETQPVLVGSENKVTDQTINADLHQRLLYVIEKCLQDLRQRVIIIESFLNERGYKEIAEQLGLTIGNVHVLRHRALRLLRECHVFIELLGDYFE